MGKTNHRPNTQYEKKLFDFLNGLPAGIDRLSPDDYARLQDVVTDALLKIYDLGYRDGQKDGREERDAQAANLDNLLRGWTSRERSISH